jgi:hypothetical protein
VYLRMSFAITRGFLLSACSKPADSSATNKAAGTGREPHLFQPIERTQLAAIAKEKLHLAGPATPGSPVTLTTQAPSSSRASLVIRRASLFDPSYGPRGVSGNDTGTLALESGFIPKPARLLLWGMIDSDASSLGVFAVSECHGIVLMCMPGVETSSRDT